LLKLAGGIAAVVSFFLTINQFTGILQGFRIHHKEFSDAMRVGQQQLERGDYPAAFESFQRATELDPVDRDAQYQQARVAMAWLDNLHTNGRTFTEVVGPLVPALDKALVHAKGRAAADLIAHIGWANFLKSRDGQSDTGAIEQSYRGALKLDAQNPYAHAMWGHWILWQNGDVSRANEHFAEALQSGRERAHVRHMQIRALCNPHRVDAEAELFRVANAMRQGQEAVDRADRRRVFQETIEQRLEDISELTQVLGALKPDDAEATYDWLASDDATGDAEFRQRRRDFILAAIAESAGQPREALARYRSLRSVAEKSHDSSALRRANMAIQRLAPSK
jgi:tetratricopeptide (TPR) repeat protein